MEQLGIEEEDDSDQNAPFERIADVIVDLKQKLDIKYISIIEIEAIIEHLSERVDLLEKLFLNLRIK